MIIKKDLEINVRKATKSLQNENIGPEEKSNIEITIADLKYGNYKTENFFYSYLILLYIKYLYQKAFKNYKTNMT